MSEISNLSIADLKASSDFLKELKKEKLEFNKQEGRSNKEDEELREIENLQFKFNDHLYRRIMILQKK